MIVPPFARLVQGYQTCYSCCLETVGKPKLKLIFRPMRVRLSHLYVLPLIWFRTVRAGPVNAPTKIIDLRQGRQLDALTAPATQDVIAS